MTAGAQGAKLLLMLVGLVVLSRLLSPADFGLVATLTAFVALGELIRDFGLSMAAVQATRLDAQQKTNLFYINAGVGLLLSAALAASGPIIAVVFDDWRLTGIAVAMSPLFLLNGLQVQFQVELVRSLRFGVLASTDVVAAAVGLIAGVVVATSGGSYWALVLQSLVGAAVMLVLRICVAGWRPGLPRHTPGIAPFLRYGGYLGVANVLQYAATYADTFVIAGRFGAEALGFYNRAFQLLMVPLGQMLAPLTNVALPVLARVQEDRVRLFKHVRMAQLGTGYPAAFVFGFMLATAEPLVAVLLGEGWLESVPVLRFLAVAGLFNVLSFNGYWVFLATGRTGSLAAYNAVTKSISVCLVIVGSAHGIVGVSAGFAAGMIVAWPVCIVWLHRATGMPWATFFTGGLRVLLVGAATSAAAAGATLLAAGQPAWIQLVVGVGGGLVGWLAVTVTVGGRDARDMLRLLQGRRGGERG